ncbi:MAG TPA: hypothetical protein VJQ52_03770 [Steroidobacteraceae bacterium]|nr:hypothetical protein [Steroidobacteraceae bacterium]
MSTTITAVVAVSSSIGPGLASSLIRRLGGEVFAAASDFAAASGSVAKPAASSDRR